MRFKDFFEATGGSGTTYPLTGTPIDPTAQVPNLLSLTGASSLTDILGQIQNFNDTQNPDYHIKDILTTVARAAESIAATIINGRRKPDELKYATVDANPPKQIMSLEKDDIITSSYTPSRGFLTQAQYNSMLGHPDCAGVIFTDNQGLLGIDITKLKIAMIKIGTRMSGKKQGQQLGQRVAGVADKAMQAMTQGKLQISNSAAPK